MIRLFLLAVLCTTFSQNMSYAQLPSKEIWYVGTFSESGSKGLYVMEFDRLLGQFTELQTVHDRKSPSFVSLHPSNQFLYAAYREGMEEGDPNGTIVAYRIDAYTGLLQKINEVSSEGASPCHVSVDPSGDVVFVSNYQGGNLASYKIREDGGLHPASSVFGHEGSNAKPDRQSRAHMHSVIPSLNGNFAFASDLGADRIFTYKVESNTGSLLPAKRGSVRATPGSGPRHFVLHREIPFAYSIEELSNTVAVYQVNPYNGRLRPKGRYNLLSNQVQSEQNSAADIHISVDGKWLYASNRGQDNLAIFKINPADGALTAVGHVPSGGLHPRNFRVDELGEFVYVANMNSDQIIVFSYDSVTGSLNPTEMQVQIPRPACVVQLFINPR
ncbi:hypothetical protein ADIS_2837 [Lunatimonas lonarensis]|uniref:6-phosphogluconolactonase n=1 Tax=Lunatimonas lonarensis TaxID=1232681 RepID=R7ZQM6_9BACT|nr:lactonase family protein [Lunatimonas lonarensis]EON76387.1 hypothetical protein ADIS_2837 [Lunatimonas lonarensis]